MAVRCHVSFFRAGKSTPSSLSLKLPPGRNSVEECREAFLKCLYLTALKVRAFVIRWNGGTRTSIGKALYRSNLVSRFSTTKNPSVHLHFFPSFLSCWPRRTSQVLLPKTAFLTDLSFLKNICVSMSFIFRRRGETSLQKLRSS